MMSHSLERSGLRALSAGVLAGTLFAAVGAAGPAAASDNVLHPNGTATYLAVPDEVKPWLGAGGDDWGTRALAVVSHFRDLFGLHDPAQQLTLGKVRKDLAGGAHVRLQQRHRGVPVEGGELIVHFDRNGMPTSITGLSVPHLDLDTTPRLTSRQAAGAALRATKGEDLKAADATLVVFNPGLVHGEAGSNHLAYKITVTGRGVRQFVFVDTADGAILASFTGIYPARNRLTYDMHNSVNYNNATLERSEGDPPVGDTDIDNAHDYAGDTYDFYFNGYGRDSIDDAGMTLESYTHYGNNYQNAFWNGTVMTYGDGFPVDDVAGHEITHGVTERTANLVYGFQPGALNESFSDIYGEAIDQVNGAGDDSDAVKWLLGEEIPNIGAIRDMSDPPAFDDPDRVGSPLYYCGFGDSGGVHTNSGVPNKNFYLLVEGGAFNGHAVSGMGLTKAAAIHYQTLVNYLGVYSRFVDHYAALQASCADLTGVDLPDPVTGRPSGEIINTTDCNAVVEADLAVEFNIRRACF